jgi:hypothetical protein
MKHSEQRIMSGTRTQNLLAAALVGALALTTTYAQTAPKTKITTGTLDIGALSRWFEAQEGPVRKAKCFPKLGDAYLGLVRQEVKNGDYEQASAVLEAYIVATNKLHTTLKAAVPDPENKSDGFKQLEAHLRESIRILNDLVFGLPVDQRDPFKAGVQDLQEINSELIKELFPRQPGAPRKES